MRLNRTPPIRQNLARGLVTLAAIVAVPFAYREITFHPWLAACYYPLLVLCTFRFTVLSMFATAIMIGTVMTWLTWSCVPWLLAGQTAFILWWGRTGTLIRIPDSASRAAPLYGRLVRAARPVLGCVAAVLAMSAAFRSAPWAECLLWAVSLGAVAWYLPERWSFRWRSAIATTLLLIASTTTALAIVEIGARQIVPPVPPPSDLYMPDPATIFTLRPNAEGPNRIRDNAGEWRETSARTSSQGVCGPEYEPKAADEFRIVMLGDSFTFGHALSPEENFPQRLEQALNAAGVPKRVTVINCGVGGFAPWQERHFLRERGFGFDPDLVILQIFPANDVPGTLTRVGKRLPVFDRTWEARLSDFQRRSTGPVRAARWLEAHCRTYVAITRILERPSLAQDILADLRFVAGPVFPRMETPEPGNANLEASRVEMYPELEEAWRLMEEDIRGNQADCRDRGVDIIAFCHPFVVGVLETGTRERDTRMMGDVYEWNLDVQRTHQLFKRAGIPDVDVTEALESYPDREDLHFKYDGHFTAKGAEVVADTLAEYLLRVYFPQKLGENSGADTGT